MGILEDIMGQANSDVGKCVDVLQGMRKRFLSKCSTCADTGQVRVSSGVVPCHCPLGKEVTDPNKRLPR